MSFAKSVHYRKDSISSKKIITLDKKWWKGSKYIQENKSTALITIPKTGDLIHRIYVTSSTPGIINCDDIIDNVKITIGGQLIDRHSKEYLQILSKISVFDSKQKNFKDNYRNYYSSDSKNSIENSIETVQIPLQFWFCRNIDLALPLISLHYHQVKLEFTWGKIEDIGVAAELDIKVEYFFLNFYEGRRFLCNEHEYFIEQLQTNQIPMKQINTFDFIYPIKELYWTISDNFSYNKAELSLNGNSVNGMMPEEYYQLQQPLKYVNYYSFDLQYEYSRLSMVYNYPDINSIDLKFKEYNPESIVNVYSVNYNILRIMGGLAGLAYVY